MSKDEKEECRGEHAHVIAQLPDGRYLVHHHTAEHEDLVKFASTCDASNPRRLHRQEDGSYSPASTGTSRAATPQYREGWGRIFGKPADVGQA